MRILGKLLAGLLATLVILVLTLFLAINLVDWNKHKGFLVKNVERYTSIRIDEVDGIRVQLWRSAEFEWSHIKLHSDDAGMALQSFASGPLKIRVAVAPLILKRQLLIQS